MNNVQTVVSAIRNMNTDEINQVIHAIKLHRTHLARQKINTIRVGDVVSFAARSGMQVVGVVTKVNIKTVSVRQNNSFTTWRVHANLLKKVTPLTV
jgi:hypothetical protein